jgi:beta-N-acetylhexosaminidase
MRAFITGVAGLALTDRERAFLREAQPWGLILFRRNAASPDQLRGLIGEMRDVLGRLAPVLIDQEGGRVQRLGPPHWPVYPPGAAYGAAYDRDPGQGLAAARLGARLIAADLSALGIDVDCLPIADIPVGSADPIVGDRAYGSEPGKVAAIAKAVAQGLADGGVLPVVKHIPGHGRAAVDSHKNLPVVEAGRALLEGTDFAAFMPLADLPMAMTAHVVFKAIDPVAPATVSATIVREVIRGFIGFDGLLMSDDISMQALSGTVAERARAAIAAGCDIVLHCNGEISEMSAVAANVPRLERQAARRADRALAAKKAPAPLDQAAARTEFFRLMAGSWQPAEPYA